MGKKYKINFGEHKIGLSALLLSLFRMNAVLLKLLSVL